MSVNIQKLVEQGDLAWQEARQFLGQKCDEGVILGVTGKPGFGYPEGVYLTVVHPQEKTKHFKVGEMKDD